MKVLKAKSICYSLVCVLLLGMGCHAFTKTQKGASIGAGAGAVVGALIGKSAGNTALGAIIGGAVGGTAGAFIGKTMDTRAADFRKSVPDATFLREGDGIIVKFNGGILFDQGSSDLKPEAKVNLQNLSTALQKSPETVVVITGYTDNSRAETRNASSLSYRRAQAVRDFIASGNISLDRFIIRGKGATTPAADNSTADGRAKNRRVEITVSASKQLQKEAKYAAE
jgi:outer membrane protein OmpA-like peptidoglycan-associated protein